VDSIQIFEYNTIVEAVGNQLDDGISNYFTQVYSWLSYGEYSIDYIRKVSSIINYGRFILLGFYSYFENCLINKAYSNLN